MQYNNCNEEQKRKLLKKAYLSDGSDVDDNTLEDIIRIAESTWTIDFILRNHFGYTNKTEVEQ